MEVTASTWPLERRIWLVRGQRVMLDTDLAELYGVSVKHLNQQVRRNASRFPSRYAFCLGKREAKAIAAETRASGAGRGRYRKYLPIAFTEHGAVMLASVLKSDAAIKASIQVVDAFVRLRTLIAERDGLGRKMEAMERRLDDHSGKIDRIFDVLQDLLQPAGPAPEPEGPPRKIGFRAE